MLYHHSQAKLDQDLGLGAPPPAHAIDSGKLLSLQLHLPTRERWRMDRWEMENYARDTHPIPVIPV
jgi:hypothetical protein